MKENQAELPPETPRRPPHFDQDHGKSPVLRAIERTGSGYRDVLVLWVTRDSEGVNGLKGFVCLDEHTKKRVQGSFVESMRGTFIAVRSLDGTLHGNGNAINQQKTGTCYFDTVVFQFGEKAVFAKITSAVDEALHARMGFDAQKQDRPRRERPPRM